MSNFQISLSQELQDGFEEAVKVCIDRNHRDVGTEHLFYALLLKNDPILLEIIKQANLNVQQLVHELSILLDKYPKDDGSNGGNVYWSKALSKLIERSQNQLIRFKETTITTKHIVLALLEMLGPLSDFFKNKCQISEANVLSAVSVVKTLGVADEEKEGIDWDFLKRFTINLTDLAKQNELDPMIGRDKEVRRVMQILVRRNKNNPVLVGDPGVGKTAIVEGLARRIVSGDVPKVLKNKKILILDLGLLVSGASFYGELEGRIKGVVREVSKAVGGIILFIDELHVLMGAGVGSGPMNAANLLKPDLARGKIKVIGATTFEEYSKYIEKDRALERRFQKVRVDEPTDEDVLAILRGVKERYEIHHKLKITDTALSTSIELSKRYIKDRFLPDKAIDLIDEAASRIKIQIESQPEELDNLERKILQLEMEKHALISESKSINKIEEDITVLKSKAKELRDRWTEEQDTLEKISNTTLAIERANVIQQNFVEQGNLAGASKIKYEEIPSLETQLNQYKDDLDVIQKKSVLVKGEVTEDEIANVVSAWTGIPVKKIAQTEKSKLKNLEGELHKRVISQDDAINSISNTIRRNKMGLTNENRPIASFLFAGPTGVGKTELAKALAENLFGDEKVMIRIDMSEYQEGHSTAKLIGSPPGYVGYGEGGQLTEAVKKNPYCIILLDEVEKAHRDVFDILLQTLDDGRMTDGQGRTVDFTNAIIIMTSNIGSQYIASSKASVGFAQPVDQEQRTTKQNVISEIKKEFKPEFINRLDDIIIFQKLTNKDIKQIVKLQLDTLQGKVEKKGIVVSFNDGVIEFIADNGFDKTYGARSIRRFIQSTLETEISKLLVSYDNISKIDVNVKDGELEYVNA